MVKEIGLASTAKCQSYINKNTSDYPAKKLDPVMQLFLMDRSRVDHDKHLTPV